MKARAAGPGWGLVGLWVVAASAAVVGQSWLFEANFLASLASFPVMLMVGFATLAALVGLKAWLPALVFVVATAALLLLPIEAAGHQAWTRISFAQHKSAYQRVVARADALPDQGTFAGEAYHRDGQRIVFPRAEGMPDGWSGVVYDPTNTLPLTRNRSLSAFGSRTQSCIRIEQDWYRCWFD